MELIMKSNLKIFTFTALLSLISFERLVVSVFVKRFKSPFGSCVSKRPFNLNAYKLFKRGFLFYESFRNLIITHISDVMLTNTLNRAFPDKGTGANTNTRSEATHSPVSPKRYTANDPTEVGKEAKRFSPISILKQWGFGGNPLFSSTQPVHSPLDVV